LSFDNEWKESELGLIPINWTVKRIKEIGEVIGGGTPSTKRSEYYDGDIPWITPKDLSDHIDRYIFMGERSITKEGLNNSSAKLLPKGTVLFSSRAPIGYVAIAGQELCTNQGFKSIVCNESVNNLFIYYTMKMSKEAMESIASGSTFKEVSGSTVKEFKIKIPPLREQKEIAGILSSLDDKIELNNAINKNIEEMAQALFKRWFVDFEFPNKNGEPYKSSGGEFEESELGLIPKGWRVEFLPDWIDFLEGPGIRNWQYKEEGIKFLNIRCIKNQDLDLSTANKVSTEEANGKYKHFLLEEGDVVVSTSGTLGRSAIVRKEHLPLMLNTSIIRFRPKNGMCYSYMYSYLISQEFINELNTKASGSVQLNFGPKHLKTIKLVIPPKRMLTIFENIIGPLIAEMCRLKSENSILSIIRDTLLPKLMSGEIRVPVDQP